MTKHTGHAEVVEQKVFNIRQRKEGGHIVDYAVAAEDLQQALVDLRIHHAYEDTSIEGVQQMMEYDGVLVRRWVRVEQASIPTLVMVEVALKAMRFLNQPPCTVTTQASKELAWELYVVLADGGLVTQEDVKKFGPPHPYTPPPSPQAGPDEGTITNVAPAVDPIPPTNHANGSWQHESVSLPSPMAGTEGYGND